MNEDYTDFIEASGLLKYDPEIISKIYQKNPSRLFKRLWQTLIPIFLYIISVGWDKLTGQLKKESKARFRAKQLTNLLVELGPAFVKAGQALSTRPDIIPVILLEELSELQDQLPGFDGNKAMELIEEDLNKKINEIFLTIDKDPISAASLGQVHKGVLKNKEIVAVKVQRPGLREQITLDLYIVRNIANWLKNNIGFIRSDLVALIDELGKRVFEEMDYLNEAENAEKFRNLHLHNSKIAVPKIYKETTSRRVLTMEWIDGTKLTNLEGVKNLGIDPDKMIEIGVQCSLEQLLEHGFFHADPHPGNLLALKDGRLCYLDFGMMSEVSRSSRSGLIQAVVHLVNKNFDKLSQDFVKLGFLSKEVNLEPIVPAFQDVFVNAVELGVSKMDFKSVTDDMSGVMYKFPFQLPPYYALIIRSLLTLEGIALSVDPDFKILGAAYPYFARRLMEDPDPQLRESLKEMLFDKKQFKWDRLEDLLSNAAKQTNLDLEKLLDEVINLLFSPKGGFLRDEIINGLTIQIDLIGLKLLKSVNNFLPKSIKLNVAKEDNNINDLILSIEPFKNFLEIIQKIPGYSMDIFLKRMPRLINEPYTKEMSFKIAKKVTEKGVVRLVKIAAGSTI
ncbi:ABC1 kinase family protein [Prochlorococcus sp.]|mgnify:FL=1|jgi:predicted unusual protein kinase regulating ubiquinone biosynthesis (AarF/ABC1/UbiB family)|uniref:ABC1 kinase family protein n=1 Tax=Prochlorococcus sp. TaxID=1220 RepID=UPI000025E9D6